MTLILDRDSDGPSSRKQGIDAGLVSDRESRLPEAALRAVDDYTGLELGHKATLEGARAVCAI